MTTFDNMSAAYQAEVEQRQAAFRNAAEVVGEMKEAFTSVGWSTEGAERLSLLFVDVWMNE